MSELKFLVEMQVPKRELCEQLRDAGFPQDTVFAWVRVACTDERTEERVYAGELHQQKLRYQVEWSTPWVAAPLVGEMRKFLEESVLAGDCPFYWGTDVYQYVERWLWDGTRIRNRWRAFLYGWTSADTEANAHALTCLALLRAMEEEK